MNTTEAPGSVRAVGLPRLRPDPRFVRRLVLVNGAVPGLLLAYDALRGQLGANGTSYALHTTGLLALLFFVMSLAVTPLRRLTGWAELVAGRRALGLYGFFYLVVHFGIFCVLDRGGSLSSIVTEILKRRYLQIGAIALVSFVPLAVTSTDRMITRLGPRRWKRLHRVTYVATSLGALHYILLVKSDVRQPAVFAVALGALLGFRVIASWVDRRARAKKRPWSGELKITEVIEETHDVRTFRFIPLAAAGKVPFEHRAGQYLNLALTIDGQRVNRSYTIASSAARSDYCEITVKKARAGGASSHLHEALREGAVVKVTAPAGRFVFDGEGDGLGVTRVLLVAGGVGITPLMAMVRTLSDRRWKGRIDLVYSVKTKDDVVFAKELEELVAKRSTDLHVHLTLTREPPESPWTGARGAITRESLARAADGASLREVPIYLCGPDAMMDAMKSLFADLGAPPENVHLEAFVSPPSAPAPDAAVAEETLEEAKESPARGGAVTVQFAVSGLSTSVEEGATLLDAAEEMGVDIPFDCRAGICGQCKTKLVSGRVVMDVQDALTADDRSRRLVLACQARPVCDVVVDA
jgi:ferredoxin-NADP reductase/DMSO/TMAO reductase YedYZ heme-binding membrane subunit